MNVLVVVVEMCYFFFVVIVVGMFVVGMCFVVQFVIFVGGFGMCLWLMLCECFLKQLIGLFGDYLLLQLIVLCFDGLMVDYLLNDDVLIVCGEDYCFMIVEQLCLMVKCVIIMFELFGCDIVFVLMFVVLWFVVDGNDVVMIVMLVDYVVVDLLCFYVVVVVGVYCVV